MQALGAVTHDDLMGRGQELLYKLEVYDGATWWNLCNLHEALVDGGLELWNSATDPTSWIDGLTGTSTVNRDAVEVHGGLYSCRLDVDASNSYVSIIQQNIILKCPLNYRVSGWYMTEAGKTAQYAVYDSAANVYLTAAGAWTPTVTFIELPAAISWTWFETPFTPHLSYTNYVAVFVRKDAASSSIWFDDISVAAVPGNYLVNDSLSMNLGGAGVSPDPIAGEWSATIANDDGIFHPRHPNSEFVDLLRVGRKVRISVGAKFGGVDYCWQRMIGYMDAPTFDNVVKTVSVSGGDYMKPLTDTILRSPGNYWGSMATLSSVLSVDVLGSEIYNEADAMDIDGEANNVTNWTAVGGSVASVADDTGEETYGVYNGELTKTYAATVGYAQNNDIGSVTVGKLYKVSFAYKRTAVSGGVLSVRMYETGTTNLMGKIDNLTSSDWTAAAFYFTATKTSAVRMRFQITTPGTTASRYRFDYISIREVTSFLNTRYNLPDACAGPYYATLDGIPHWYGEVDPPQGWLYDEDLKIFYFASNFYVTTGTDNLLVYYYTAQAPENVVADLLAAGPGDGGGGAGLYANQAAALAAMDYTATGITIDRVWFDAGTSALDAIRQICERVNYRFWFDALGVPHFKPAPTHGDSVAGFTSRTIADESDFQDIEEIRNRIVIEGIEQSMYREKPEIRTSRFKGEASDATSLAAYLEKPYSTVNRLFQDQTSIDAMCATILAAYKDPKLYADLRVPYNAIPLERGDTVMWDIDFRPPVGDGVDLGLKNEVRGIIRDASFSGGEFTYKCEMRSGAMNISNYATTPVTVTAEHCRGWCLTNAGAGADTHFDLPAAVVGMEITFYVMAAQTLTIDPNGTDRIAVLTGTNGDYLRSDNVIGSCIKLGCLVAGYWHCLNKTGTWTEE